MASHLMQFPRTTMLSLLRTHPTTRRSEAYNSTQVLAGVYRQGTKGDPWGVHCTAKEEFSNLYKQKLGDMCGNGH